MVNYFIYAKDFSGSTEGATYFHENGLKTLEQFKCDVEKIKEALLAAGEPPTESKVVYLHWGDVCYDVSEEIIRRTYEELDSGNMCTYPQTIIERLKETYILNKNDKIILLYIITDGCIDSNAADECFQLNEKMHYETVVFHALNEDENEIDLSLAASFFKSRCLVYCNYKLYDSTDISNQFEYEKINVDNFKSEKDELKSYIKLKFIKKGKPDALALQEIDKLKKLRDRLLKELSSKTGEKRKVNLETKDRNLFISEFVNTDWYKNLNKPVSEDKVEIEKAISTLINYIVSDTKSYSFDTLKFNKKFDEAVEQEQIDDVNFTAQEEIEFPDIILDDEKGIPVIILAKLNLLNKIIFHTTQCPYNQPTSANFSKFKSTMECPLFLMNDQGISKSIGYFYTLNVYKQFVANNIKNEPRTRKPFHGGLVLTNTDQFDKYNDYILSATYFNSKKINYNVGLFYYVLWKNCENKEWMNRNVVEQFKKYTMRRISETKCKIGLSCLPLDPHMDTSLLTALWYCAELSSCIFKNDPENFKHERLRLYYGVARYMIEILKHFAYDLDLNSIEKRRELISHVMVLKKIQGRKEKVHYLLEKIFKTVNGFLVSEIERPFNLHILGYLDLNHKEMLCDDIVEDKVHLNEYVHLMYFEGDLEASKADKRMYEICEKTLRPYFVIDQNTSFYTELAKNTRKIVIHNDDDRDKIAVAYEPLDSLEFDKILSRYRLFIDCVRQSENYPTLDEYFKFVSKKKKFSEDLVTIFPPNVYFEIKNAYECYQKFLDKFDVKEFIKTCDAYVNRIKRIKAEGRVEFSDNNEINEFISREASKVNLKRKLLSKVETVRRVLPKKVVQPKQKPKHRFRSQFRPKPNRGRRSCFRRNRTCNNTAEDRANTVEDWINPAEDWINPAEDWTNIIAENWANLSAEDWL